MTKRQRKKLNILRAWQRDIPNIYTIAGFEPNGCTASPDWFVGFWIQPACDYHDYLYWKGGTEKDRKRADTIFLAIMHHIIRNSWLCKHVSYFRNRSRVVAGMYYGQVTEFGKDHFNYHG